MTDSAVPDTATQRETILLAVAAVAAGYIAVGVAGGGLAGGVLTAIGVVTAAAIFGMEVERCG